MIERVPEAGSTNTVLLERLARGEFVQEARWLVADRQLAGRGRAGRTWVDGGGNFMGSTVVALCAGDPAAPTLALVAGVALHRAVSVLAPGLPELLLKWPNDLLVAGAKLAGVLLERRDNHVVVGIGCNLAVAPDVPGRSTTALAALGHACPRDTFAEVLAAEWARVLAAWHDCAWPDLRKDWAQRALPIGTLLVTHDADLGPLTGAFAGVDEHGAAQLRLADGTSRAVHAGDLDLAGA